MPAIIMNTASPILDAYHEEQRRIRNSNLFMFNEDIQKVTGVFMNDPCLEHEIASHMGRSIPPTISTYSWTQSYWNREINSYYDVPCEIVFHDGELHSQEIYTATDGIDRERVKVDFRQTKLVHLHLSE